MNYQEQQKAKNLFRDWMNNYLTVEVFAEHNGLTRQKALDIIDVGRIIHNNEAALLKEMAK